MTLVGSGPGSVSLLTLGALQAIQTADLVLADKLVPQQVLDVIPLHTTQDCSLPESFLVMLRRPRKSC